MAEGLKAMALEGHGVAFLPFSAVKKELRAQRLVSAMPPDLPALHITMDIRAYRETPPNPDASRAAGRGTKGIAASGGKSRALATKTGAQALWTYLLQQPVPG